MTNTQIDAARNQVQLYIHTSAHEKQVKKANVFLDNKTKNGLKTGNLRAPFPLSADAKAFTK